MGLSTDIHGLRLDMVEGLRHLKLDKGGISRVKMGLTDISRLMPESQVYLGCSDIRRDMFRYIIFILKKTLKNNFNYFSIFYDYKFEKK